MDNENPKIQHIQAVIKLFQSMYVMCNATNINGMIMSSWIIRVIIYYVLLANVALTNYVCHYLFIGQFDWNRIISIKIKEWKKNIKKRQQNLSYQSKKIFEISRNFM